MRRCIMIVIPEVIKKPKFDLEEDRPLTIEEKAEVQDYEDKLSNYINTSTVLNAWPVNGDWDQVIDDKGPIYLKDNNRYHVYCLDADRIDLADVKSFIYREETDFSGIANIELGHITKLTAQEWLEKNGYEQIISHF